MPSADALHATKHFHSSWQETLQGGVGAPRWDATCQVAVLVDGGGGGAQACF